MTKILTLMLGLIMTVTASATLLEKPEKLEGKVGERIRLSVETNPSTGYSWMIKTLPKELIFVSSHYAQGENCKKDIVGCPGKLTFIFIAQQSGKSELELIHGQSFNKASWGEKTIPVDIK